MQELFTFEYMSSKAIFDFKLSVCSFIKNVLHCSLFTSHPSLLKIANMAYGTHREFELA